MNTQKTAGLAIAIAAVAIAGYLLLAPKGGHKGGHTGGGGSGVSAGNSLVRGIVVHRRQKFDEPDRPKNTATTSVGFESGAQETAVDAQLKLLDPSSENWETEILSDSAARVLKSIFRPGADFGIVSKGAVAGEFQFIPASRPPIRQVYSDGTLSVHRAKVPEDAEGQPAADRIDLPFGEGSPQKITFKIVRIEPTAMGFDTRLLVKALYGAADGGVIQVTSNWQASWERAQAGDARATTDKPESDGPQVQLVRLHILDWETVTRSSAAPLFEDITDAIIPQGFTAHHYPLNYWASRMTKIDDAGFFGYHGLAIGDANGDGLDDLYVCDTGGLPNRLFLQNSDGSLRDVSEAAGVDWLEQTRSALFVDLDNDGDQDLVAASVGLLLVMKNGGDGVFALEGGIPGLSDAYSLCAADYDADGDLDIHVCNYGPEKSGSGDSGFEASQPMPYNDAKNGGRNALFRNDGGFAFVDVAEQVGLSLPSDQRWSYAASWEDFDNDGDQDLYVANDFGRNNLFRNDGGKFIDVAADAGVEDMATGMSIAWGDVNRDGHMDAYISNMYSSAGGRIAFQRQFGTNLSGEVEGFQRMARGNTLFLAKGDGRTFRDASESDGVNMGQWAWSSQIADLNNDGWQDIVVSNGYLTNQEAGGRDL